MNQDPRPIYRQLARCYISLALVLMCGCAVLNKTNTPPPLPPGFVNQYDADIFNGLVTANAAINQAKASFGTTAEAKAPINGAIKAYNDARAAYLTWHAAAATGVPHTSLDNLMSIMLGAIAAVNQQFGTPATIQPPTSHWFEPNRISIQEGL